MNRYVIEEGMRSFRINKGKLINPYDPGTQNHNDFERGWTQALKRAPDELLRKFKAGSE